MSLVHPVREIGCALLLAALTARAASEVAKAPVPRSPYLPLVYRYADTMLERGRDATGTNKTGLFLSALDRSTLAPLTNRPAAPDGVREAVRVGSPDGALVGANPQHDENLLRLLYTLSELSSKPKYRDAADAELKWFLNHARPRLINSLPWAGQMSWDLMSNESMLKVPKDEGVQEIFRPWMLWDRCFDLAPEASGRFAHGLWEHDVANSEPVFDRRPGFPRPSPREGRNSPRRAGFYIRTWAVAYAKSKDPEFLRCIEVFLGSFEKKRHPQTGLIEAYKDNPNAASTSTLSLAIDCDGAADRVPEPLAARLRAFAAREDEVFCALAHDLKNQNGFVTGVEKTTGKPVTPPSSRWNARPGDQTTAQVGLMCVSRYDNTGRIGYRDLIFATADAYLNSLPADDADVWPGAFGQAISLQVAAWRHSAKPVYLERARKFADLAVEKFWGTNALPRASFKTDHYETVTHADSLALALVELHLHILHITAVRCPPNTIDR